MTVREDLEGTHEYWEKHNLMSNDVIIFTHVGIQ